MASALARGIGEPVLVPDVDARQGARRSPTELGGEAVGSNAELAERADVVVLCHKPKQLEEVAERGGAAARSAVVSILAATTHGAARGAPIPGAPVYRFIPNIPAEVRPRRALLRARAAARRRAPRTRSSSCSAAPAR